MTEPLTDEQIRTLGSRLAGVCDGAVDEAAEWIAPVVARMVAEAADAREAEVRARVAAVIGELPALTEGEDRLGTATWRDEAIRDAYSLAIEEAQTALRAALPPADNDGEASRG